MIDWPAVLKVLVTAALLVVAIPIVCLVVLVVQALIDPAHVGACGCVVCMQKEQRKRGR